MGRITMNPIKHVDPLGTIIFPLMLALSRSPVIFGWAKPVPVSRRNFKNPRKDMTLVALAGPLSNVLLAMVFALALKVLLLVFGPGALSKSKVLESLAAMLWVGMNISIYLGVFNLFPVYPLDGSHIVEGILPEDKALVYSRMERYGSIILIVLLFTGVLQSVIRPVYALILIAIRTMFGI
ncbi:MAG: site-2 protease family protein [bacterium]|nr:MAG: site-2 protease family protein [bacterium]